MAAVSGALGMVSFVLAAGLAIDISHLYLAGSELQNAADASAIAGASVINGAASGITSAVNVALATQNKFEFAKDTATFSRADVQFSKNVGGPFYSEETARGMADQIRFIKVTIPNKAIPVSFAQVALGANSVNVSRSSVAGFSKGLQVLCDSIVPLSVVQDPVTQAPLDIVGSCPNTYEFTPGCRYVVRRGAGGNGNGNNGSGFISPGNYLILALGASRGGADARAGVAGSAAGCFKVGDEVGTEPGVTAGPIKQGLGTRFGDYQAGLSSTTFPPDLNVKEGITYAQYLSALDDYYRGLTPSASIWTAPDDPGRVGRRIIVIPVINKNEYDNGRGTVRIAKFAAMFLQTRVANGNGGDISAEFITHKVQITDGYFSGGTDADNQFSIPVLYK
ncbi:MAG: hypothetical protein HYR56_30160 [Acidobacteria bacterium]|nr:hypothetical protein [Acidobacteriota bacterium]MBI3423683.1 hypothetical protein [Acidobacteriota bacterium]